jgi:hypothetical protein
MLSRKFSVSHRQVREALLRGRLRVRQPIEVRNLAWIAHAVPARALRELMAQVRERDRAPSSAALLAFEPEHGELGGGFAEGVGAVGHPRSGSRRNCLRCR